MKVLIYPVYSFHAGLSKFGHVRPWEWLSEKDKEEYNRRIFAPDRAEASSMFSIPPRDSGFWTLQFKENCFTWSLWFHPQQYPSDVWGITGQRDQDWSWLSISEPRETEWICTVPRACTHLIHQICMPGADRAFLTSSILVQSPSYWEKIMHANMDLCSTIDNLETDLSLRSFLSSIFV